MGNLEISVPAGDMPEIARKLNGGGGGKHDLSRARPIVPVGTCNVSDEQLLSQIGHNVRLGLPQCRPHEVNPVYKALLVCGGPSLEETKDELREQLWLGNRIVAVNGAYDWCVENNLKPSVAVMIDAREFNARFVERPVPGCKYLLSSQCHPRAFENCRDRETYIWHALGTGSEKEHELLQEYYFKCFYPVTLGVTIGIRAISLMRMLGYRDMEIFGLDSCWLGDKHHAYAQPENDNDGAFPVWLRVRDGLEFRDEKAMRFVCSVWHMKQAHDFQQLIRERGHMFRFNVHGPGLLATMMRTGAMMQVETDEAKGVVT